MSGKTVCWLDEPPEPSKTEDFDERVCRTQPLCACGGGSPYECNCLRWGVCCVNCGVKLVSVETYERTMKGRTSRARRMQ
jgi:hypothetical protein